MANYLITGVAGFIGSHIAEAAIAQGHHVRGLDNFATGHAKNFAHVKDKLEFREIDVCDAEAVTQACDEIDVIFHEAALPSVPRSIEEPRPSHEINLQGTFNVLEGARLAKVKRVVYAASSSAYGDQPGFPRVETMLPQPMSPYAVQKLAGELYLQTYSRVFGLETVALRYFNVFGPRQAPDSPYSGVMAKFIMEMFRGHTPTIFGDGQQSRDFTFIDNVVSANLLAATAPAHQCTGRVFNVGCGAEYTLNETYAALRDLMDFPNPANYGPSRAGDVRNSLADISAAQTALGYQPIVGFHEGLERTVSWYRKSFQA